MESKPLDVLLNGVYIFGILLGGVGVIKAQVAYASMLFGHTKIKADSLGMSDMEITVGFGREAGLYTTTVLTLCKVFLNHLLNEIQTLFLAAFSNSILCHILLYIFESAKLPFLRQLLWVIWYFCDMTDEKIQELVRTAERCECAAFINGDPIQFPHRYSDRRDIEVSGFISAWMAYGSRKVFLGVLERLHSMMDAAGGPYRYIVSRAWKSVSGEQCLYRFYKWTDFMMLCERLSDIYLRMDSLEYLFNSDETLEKGVFRLCREFEGVNGIPVPGSTSANKRLYMFLRWMVRKGSPVDLGIWTQISPSQLLIPVDTHVYTVAKALGLTSRSSADLKASVEITGQMGQIWPDDPARGDFALYGSQVM